MAGIDQYLRIGIGGMEYLLHSSASVAIEQRGSLVLNEDTNANIAAWRSSGTKRWPAYCLDAELRIRKRIKWERAVFVNDSAGPIGLIADEILLLPQAQVRVESFTPLGAPPTSGGHVFSGAWVSEGRLLLVFEPQGLTAYLHTLGD